VLFYSLEILTETFPILRPNKHYVINLYWSSCKVPIILVECKLNWNFLDGYLKHRLIRNFMKTLPVGTELFYVDGKSETHRDRLTVRRSNGWTDRDCEVNSLFFSKFC